MHAEVMEFVEITRSLFPKMFVGKRVLEIGSQDINGGVRTLFSDCDYIGLDVAPGNGVDIVCEGQNYDAPDESFDVVISCEVMEHNPFWAETLTNMIRLLKPGGLMVMSCATVGRGEHGTARTCPAASPLTVEMGWDYYKNLTKWHITRKVDLSSLSAKGFVHYWGGENGGDLYFLAQKAGAGEDATRKIARFKAIYRARFFAVISRQINRVVHDPLLIPKILEGKRWK